MAKFAEIKESQIQDSKLRSQFRKLKAKQGGFTLLELLVVVAIMAAIAGTATMALQDTDARAAAAAHVSMMDELQKGVHTFKALNGGFPDKFDSLISLTEATSPVITNAKLTSILAIEDVGMAIQAGVFGDTSPGDSSDPEAQIAKTMGITQLMYVDGVQKDDGAGTACLDANLTNIVASRDNSFVAGNIFSADSGCGTAVNLSDTTPVAVWTGGNQRISHQQTNEITPTAAGVLETDTAGPVYMAVGMGPSSTLFDTEQLGGMTSVPVYRHVSGQQYNRFIGLFNIGNLTAGNVFSAATHVKFVGVVDGAGDTKEEELGEWDGTRNTI